jgi:hypothetical protein
MNHVLAFLRTYSILVITALIIVLIVMAYMFGFRVGPGIMISRVGVLSLEDLPKGATVYADETSRGTAAATSTMSIDLVSGSHNIIVSVNGDYPWNDLISIASGKTTSEAPILIPLQPNAVLLSGTQRTTAVASIASSTLPTETNPLHLANGCADVYVSDNQVIASAVTAPGCTPPPYLCLGGKCAPTIIFAPVSPLSGVFQYPGRQDALVIGLNNTLYALALDPRNPRYFAPILTATNPKFGVLSDGTLIIENGTSVFSDKI